MRVLVTGACGFVGGPVCRLAADQPGWTVHAIGRRPADLPAGVAQHCLDLLDPAATARLLATLRPAAIVHLAGQSSVDLAAQFMDHELTPASAAIQQELVRRLHLALGEMDEADREVILMRHYEAMPNQDVAASLGIAEAAASMRYLRAMRRLKALLKPGGESADTSEA